MDLFWKINIKQTQRKIPDVTDLVKKTKLTVLEKNSGISGLATKWALTAVENKIPDVSSLVKKTDYDTKISELKNKISDHIHDKICYYSRVSYFSC